MSMIKEFVMAKNAYKRESFLYLLRKALAYVFWYIPLTWYFRRARRQQTFTFDGNKYHYHYGIYNATWRNERSVEIPIAQVLVQAELRSGARILEVGNVLGHYGDRWHYVLDRYEYGEGIINEDIASYKPVITYDTVVCISTLEHVGWDETPRHPDRLLAAIYNLQTNVLKAGGKALITMPLGYNANLDNLLETGELKFESIQCLRRALHRSRDWAEVRWYPGLVREAQYHEGYGTTIVVVATLRGK